MSAGLMRFACSRIGDRRVAALLVGQVIAGIAATVAQAAGPTITDQPHAKVRLLADRSAVVAGEALRLGVEFALDNDWHMYWITAGDPGAPAMPTTFELKAPPGFTVSGPHFPPPARQKNAEGDLYILEGKPVALFDLKAPATLADKSVPFVIEASWLVCHKSCLPGNGTLELTLPVATSAAQAAPQNGEFFSAAAESLPLATAKSSYIKIGSELAAPLTRAGQKSEVRLLLDVKPGHHAQSHTPPGDSLIATDLFLEPVAGVEVGLPTFPPGKDRTDKLFGKVSEYAGRVVVRIPLETGKNFSPGPRTLRGVLQYQACTESGTCFPPEYVGISIDLGGGVARAAVSAAGTVDHPGSAAANGAAPPQVARPPPSVKPAAGSGFSFVSLLARLQQRLESFGWIGYLIMAFLGGLVLNVMPCVLPVISLKVLSFVRQAGENRGRIFFLGMMFAAGIVTSFLILGGLAFGADQVWGGLFQRPQFSILLAALVTAMALSLFGVFHLGPPRAVEQFGAELSGEGAGSAFMMGLLATILGTACTAPFLSAVVAFAVKQPLAAGLSVFLTAGLGMASPYLLLTARPGWLRYVPRSGPWMGTFEQVMGFLLLGTAIWLLNPLPAQITGRGLVLTLIFIACTGLAGWFYGRVEFGASAGRMMRYYGASAAVLLLGWLLPFRWISNISELQAEASEQARAVAMLKSGRFAAGSDAPGGGIALDWSKGIPWQPYDPGEIAGRVRDGMTVFVDYTAEWCASCKTNEATSLNIMETRDLMRELGVVPYRADFTNSNPQIKEDFKRLGRQGVPIYAIYRPGNLEQPILLPELLTPGIVAEGLRSAGPSRAQEAASVAQRS